ncbi:hypothetical protein AALK14_02675 [Butyricimonas hominis]|uniref:hypothetical protein n=1 Tax=Butyricimonas TaxID=574697 RepID=UPI003512A165
MKETIKGIIIGIISSITASGVIYAITERFLWNIRLPLWIWLIVSVGLYLIIRLIKYLVLLYKVRNVVSEYTEGCFGNSYTYMWEFKKCKNGQYSVYGYEPTKIMLKKPLSELNNGNIYTYGHEVPENTIKLIIQLTLICTVDKSMRGKLQSVIEYLHYIENSQYHELIH